MDKRKSFKTEKSIIWDKWETIKEKSKSKNYDLEELDHFSSLNFHKLYFFKLILKYTKKFS